MQVKKFEASTLQEALDHIKRELGPEAIILQTKQNKRGFGLMSKASVEVTAAVSERAITKKSFAETRLPEKSRDAIKKLPADRQADLYDTYLDKHLSKVAQQTQDRVDLGKGKPAPQRKVTERRYIDIPDDESTAAKLPTQRVAKSQPQVQQAVEVKAANHAERMTLEEEISHLKRMLVEIKTAQDEKDERRMTAGPAQFNTPVLQESFEQLVINGVDKRYALAIVKKVGFELGSERAKNADEVLDHVALEIMNSVSVDAPLAALKPLSEKPEGERRPSVIAIVGPTGVGKTTTLAKIASEVILKKNLKVGLINVDTYKVAAFDQLATYAKILNVPFRSAASPEDLKAAVDDFQGLDLVLIDTTGRSQRDPASLKEMHALLGAIPGAETYLVLSATTRDVELYDMAGRFSVFKPKGIIVSKLDEAAIYGAVYNVSQRTKLPMLYFTTGQRVPEDIEEASGERIVALVMDL